MQTVEHHVLTPFVLPCSPPSSFPFSSLYVVIQLTDRIFAELRQRFDNGDDPNDPMGQGGNPFQGGFPGGFPGGFAQFFQGGSSGGGGGGFPGGFQFHFSPPGHHGRGH